MSIHFNITYMQSMASFSFQKAQRCSEEKNFDLYVNKKISQTMERLYGCKILFDPMLEKNDTVCNYTQARRAVAYYETTPVVSSNLWKHKDIL